MKPLAFGLLACWAWALKNGLVLKTRLISIESQPKKAVVVVVVVVGVVFVVVLIVVCCCSCCCCYCWSQKLKFKVWSKSGQ